MANNTAVLRKKQRRKQRKQTLTSPVIRRKQSQPTLTSPHRRRKKQRKQTLTSLSLHLLPLDLVEEILCRLPVKQLIQLRCVCKSWNSLISNNSNFANKHLRLSTSNQAHHHLIIKTCQFLNFQSPISTIFRDATITTATMSSYSLKEILKTDRDEDGGGYVSTCHGILCYKLDKYSALLFNPSIRKFKILPPLKFPDPEFVNLFYTLVYDRFINNYKIIALNDYPARNDYPNTKTVNIHTLGTDYWRRIQDFPSSKLGHKPMATSTGIFVNDSVNWLTPYYIVSLDLEKELYQKLSIPVANVQFRSNCGGGTLGTLRDCLSLLISMMGDFSDVWIMKEFGNEKSWTKLLSIPYSGSRYCKVLYVSEDDKVLMGIFMGIFTYMGNRLIVYDSINNTFNCPEILPKDSLAVSEIYVESLISPF